MKFLPSKRQTITSIDDINANIFFGMATNLNTVAISVLSELNSVQY